jgi:hypothetical protein
MYADNSAPIDIVATVLYFFYLYVNPVLPGFSFEFVSLDKRPAISPLWYGARPYFSLKLWSLASYLSGFSQGSMGRRGRSHLSVSF